MPSPKNYSLGNSDTNTFEFKLPDGNLCLLRPVTPADVLSLGIIDNFDRLTSLLNAEAGGSKVAQVKAANAARGKTPKAQREAEEAAQLKAVLAALAGEDGDGMGAALTLMDKIVELAVVEPACQRPVQRDEAGEPVLTPAGKEVPLQRSQRRVGVVYTDQIPLENRTAIMTRALEGVNATKGFRG